VLACAIPHAASRVLGPTYMHIHPLPIPSIPIQNRRHNHQLILRDKVPHASLELGSVVGLHGVQVEFEGRDEGQDDEQQAAEEA
jgi:hypothetical protein